MKELDKIKAPIAQEMKIFEKKFHKTMQGNVPLLNLILRYMLRRKGKLLRPALVFLSAKMNGGIYESTYIAAQLIELLHTATLVHDDIVDDSVKRRGNFSIHALWKPKVAVLIGDYLLAKGLLTSVKHNEYDLLSIVSESVREMSEGELLQIQYSRKKQISEAQYFEIISQKTASLFSACTASGAKSAGASETDVNTFSTLGKYAGIAFQIRDDLLDYTNKTGKTKGNDIKEKKMTLPLIYSFTKCKSSDKQQIIKLINNKTFNNKTTSIIQQFVTEHGGVGYARQKMMDYKEKTVDLLSKCPESAEKQSFIALMDYITDREK